LLLFLLSVSDKLFPYCCRSYTEFFLLYCFLFKPCFTRALRLLTLKRQPLAKTEDILPGFLEIEFIQDVDGFIRPRLEPCMPLAICRSVNSRAVLSAGWFLVESQVTLFCFRARVQRSSKDTHLSYFVQLTAKGIYENFQ